MTTIILKMAADDKDEEGDGNDSDVEGGQMSLHYNSIMLADCRLDEHVRHLANDLDLMLTNWERCLHCRSPVLHMDGFLQAHQFTFSATDQSWMLLPIF